MNAADAATEGLLSQEIESLASCIARGQASESYQDIVEKVRGHVLKLPMERREFWSEQVKTLGVTLYASGGVVSAKSPAHLVGSDGPEVIVSKKTKSGGTSVP